jgi:hypothetical protein
MYGLPDVEAPTFEESRPCDQLKDPPEGFSSWTEYERAACIHVKRNFVQLIKNMDYGTKVLLIVEAPSYAEYLCIIFGESPNSLARFHVLLQEMKWLDSVLTRMADVGSRFHPG